EEQHRVGELLWTGDFPQRNAQLKLLAEAANTLLFGVIAHPQRALDIRGAGARRHHITAHHATRQSLTDAQRAAIQRRLHRATRTHAKTRRVRGVGRHSDKRPAPLTAKLVHGLLEQVKRTADVSRKSLLPVLFTELIGRAHA